jgi:hypothetical protein
VLWASWLGGKHGAPQCVSRVGCIFPVVWLVGAALSIYGLIDSLRAVRGVSIDPADKSRALAQGISASIYNAVLASGALVIGTVVILMLTRRRPLVGEASRDAKQSALSLRPLVRSASTLRIEVRRRRDFRGVMGPRFGGLPPRMERFPTRLLP